MGAMKVLDREPREDADSSEHFSYDDDNPHPKNRKVKSMESSHSSNNLDEITEVIYGTERTTIQILKVLLNTTIKYSSDLLFNLSNFITFCFKNRYAITSIISHFLTNRGK